MDTHKNQFRQISIYWNGQKRDLGVCAVEMIVARKWRIEARFSRF